MASTAPFCSRALSLREEKGLVESPRLVTLTLEMARSVSSPVLVRALALSLPLPAAHTHSQPWLSVLPTLRLQCQSTQPPDEG